MSEREPPPEPQLERGVRTELEGAHTYGRYLSLEQLLSCQTQVSDSHDELLFIVIHQTTELWLKLTVHELRAARTRIRADDLQPAFKMLARVSRIQAQLIQSWDVLSTLTPVPDVFRPINPDSQESDIHQLVKGLLNYFRNVNLKTTGIDQTIPIHITEHGWPTGPTRSAERQVYLLNTIIRGIYACRTELNITHYELFSLRDADSGNPNLFYQFGLLQDDYSAKPAFYTYQQLIEQLSI